MTYKHSICFSGSGFHYPWQIGVALYLPEHYDLSECCFLGTSGGSYVAALLAVELSIRDYIRTIVKESYAVFKKHFLGLYLIYHRVLKGIHLLELFFSKLPSFMHCHPSHNFGVPPIINASLCLFFNLLDVLHLFVIGYI